MTKILKWVFLSVWIICLLAFFIGQVNAPPNYTLIPGSRWGELFGTSVIIGILSFILAIVFFAIDSRKSLANSESTHTTRPKYNFSLKRIVSRLFLTGVIGIVFGVAMFPFMTVADGLLYQQRAAIGGQNMIKAISLWGIFTLIVTLFTLWKKHFRMVSVLLWTCWFASIFLYFVLASFSSNNYTCDRSTPYQMPSEFNRALDLIAQRMDVDNEGVRGTIWQSIYNFRNCLDIQYSTVDNSTFEAVFEVPSVENKASLQDLKIRVNPSYKDYDDLTLATLLTHEIVHAGQFINKMTLKEDVQCFESESKAFVAQHVFIVSLNEEERRSIFTRLQQDAFKNPGISTFLLTGEKADESQRACNELKKKNSLTDTQANMCAWQGLENKLLEVVKSDSSYQEQCRNQK